jgi:hypothetical protein
MDATTTRTYSAKEKERFKVGWPLKKLPGERSGVWRPFHGGNWKSEERPPTAMKRVPVSIDFMLWYLMD